MNRATIARVDGSTEVLDHRPTLKEVQRIVGGYVEQVKAKHSKSGKAVTLLVDKEGKLKDIPWNIPISSAYGQSFHGGYVVGNVVILEGWRTIKT